MLFDQVKYDGLVMLGANRDRGIWANQMQLVGNRSRVTRTGGRMSSASSHTLLTVALLSALRSVTKANITNLLSKRRDGRRKPAFLVRSIDPTFFQALAALNTTRQPTLRAIKSLYEPFSKQVARFDLVFETESANNAILAALDWTMRNVLIPIELGESPVLVPSVFNVLL